jgi:hypothetical protein
MPEHKTSKVSSIYPIRHIDIFVGTTSARIATLHRALVCKDGGGPVLAELMRKSIFFDFESHPPRDTDGLIGPLVEPGDLFAAHEFTPARLPADEESLHKAEAEGKFFLLPEDWQRQLKASLENLGACARQPVGYSLAALNESPLRTRIGKCLGECMDHNVSGQRLLQGQETEDQPAQLVVANLYCTALGGMAGAVFYLIDKVKEIAADHGVRAKVVLHVLLGGDLPTNSDQQANETVFLKCLQTYSTGHFVDPLTGRIKGNPVDQVFLQSNRNSHGRLSSLERLMCHEGIRQKVLSNSPLSSQIRQRVVDVQDPKFDKNGDPLLASTMSVSRLSWDRERVLDYCSSKAAAMLAAVFRRRQQSLEAKKEVLSLARMVGLVESPEDSHLTGQVMNPADFEGESVSQRLRSSLADRTQRASGLERANTQAEVIQAVSTTELEGVYQAAMAKQAEKMLQERTERLEGYIRQRLTGQADSNQEKKGPLDVLPVLSFCRDIVEVSRQAVMDKASQIQQFIQPHQDVVNTALDQLEQVRQRPRLWRLLHPFLPARIADCLQSSGRVYLEGQLQMLSFRITVESLLEKLLDFIDSKIAELRMLDQNLQQVFACCTQKAHALATKSTIFDNPLGIDLVTQDYLQEFFTQKVTEDGSLEDFIKNLVARLMSEYRSLSVLLGKSPDQIEKLLVDPCRTAFQSRVEATDVVDQFTKRYPQQRMQLDFFRQLVLQSEGRVLAVGEIGREIVWIRFITVPRSDYQQWAKDLIEKADPKPGTWKVVVDSSSEAISMVQLRTGIALSPLIAKYDLTEGDDWKEIACRAVDRIAATIVPPSPNDQQLQTVWAKAILTDQLAHDKANGFQLRFAGSRDISLGQDPGTAMNKLRNWWPWIVQIESTFGHFIVVDDAAVARRVQQLEAQVKSSQISSDPRLALIDQRVMAEVQDQLDFLRPWAARLRMRLDKVQR